MTSLARWLVRNELWVVAPFLLAGAIFPVWMPYALLVAVIFWPLRRFVNGYWSIRTPVDLPVILLLITLPVTLWATSQIDITLPQAARLLAGAVLFYALVNWVENDRKLHMLALVMLAICLLLALVAPFVVQWPTLKLAFIPSDLYRYFSVRVSDAANPNVLAGSLVLLLPLAIGLMMFAWRELSWLERSLAVGAAATGIGVVILSQSRGAWLGLAAGLALLAILRWRWGWALVLAVIGIGLFLGAQSGAERLLELASAGTSLGGVSGRIEVWSRALWMIQDFPFTGIGMGTFGRVADLLYPFSSQAPGTVEHAHNLYLQVAVDLGIPGLVAWLAILFGTIASAWQVRRVAKGSQHEWMHGFGASLLACLAALVVHGLVDAVTWGMVRPAPIVWLVWGACVAALNLVFLVAGDRV